MEELRAFLLLLARLAVLVRGRLAALVALLPLLLKAVRLEPPPALLALRRPAIYQVEVVLLSYKRCAEKQPWKRSLPALQPSCPQQVNGLRPAAEKEGVSTCCKRIAATSQSYALSHLLIVEEVKDGDARHLIGLKAACGADFRQVARRLMLRK